MTGLKSGSGDDLWGDDGDDETDGSDGSDISTSEAGTADADADAGVDVGNGRAPDPDTQPAEPTERESDTTRDSATDSGTDDPGSTDSPGAASSATEAEDSRPTLDASTAGSQPPSDSQSYIVRRAVQDKSVQFERDERLTFFVHDDVADGERDLITELESALGRDVPKFDVREAVYRAALRNPDDVLDELLRMGYSVDEE